MMARRPKSKADELRQRILDYCQTLSLPLDGDELDGVLRRAEQEHSSHLELVERLLSRSRSAAARAEHGTADQEGEVSRVGDAGDVRLEVQRSIHRPGANGRAGHGRFHPPAGQPRLRGAKRPGQEPFDPGDRASLLCGGISRAVHHQRRTAARTGYDPWPMERCQSGCAITLGSS